MSGERFISTPDKKWYVHELRGVCYVSWVQEKDREKAAAFPAERIEGWLEVLRDSTGLDLVEVAP